MYGNSDTGIFRGEVMVFASRFFGGKGKFDE